MALTVSHLVEQLYEILFDSNDVAAGENVNPYLSACPANENCESHSFIKEVSAKIRGPMVHTGIYESS